MADRRWSHVVGLGIGVAVAGAVVAAGRSRRVPETAVASWRAAAPVLLPVGAALGWLGPAYVGEGLATTVAVLLTGRAARLWRTKSSPTDSRSVLGLALAAGALVATVVAVGVGAGAGV